jgi:hypothetical protein
VDGHAVRPEEEPRGRQGRAKTNNERGSRCFSVDESTTYADDARVPVRLDVDQAKGTTGDARAAEPK